jgi:hypothetical protein
MVFEDPQAVTLAGQGLGDGHGVVLGDANKEDEAGTFEGTHHASVDPYLSVECPLKENAHPASVP